MSFKHLSRGVLTIAMIASLAACGTVPGLDDLGAMKTGTQISEAQMSQVVNNKTTQAELIALVGHPNRKNQAGGKTIWSYDFTQIGQAIIGRNISETTVFEFNAKGVVVAHYKTGGQGGQSNNALLRAAGQ